MIFPLLRAGASPTARDNFGSTPLHHAANYGHLGCVAKLLRRGRMTPAEVDARNEDGETALHRAALLGDESICGALLAAGASHAAVAASGATPHALARQEHPTRASLLALLAGNGPARLACTACDETAEEAGVLSLRLCSACHCARYCGEACAAADWRRHKGACRAKVAEREAVTRTQNPQ